MKSLLIRFGFAYAISLAMAVSGALFGWAVALYTAPPDGGAYIPVACAGVCWTLAFTVGMAVSNHSPTDATTPPADNLADEQGRDWIQVGEGEWLDPKYKE